MLQELLKAAQTEVDNHSIYVWGGSGQLCCQVTEAWIRSMEHNRKPDMAVQEWKEVMASPYKDVARCFDCSGFVSWCLNKCGAFNSRTDCDGLFARSTEIYTPEDGCLLFRTNPANPNDETHVGIYFGGKQYHAKGRAYGVVAEPYKASYWQRLAWFKALKKDEPVPPEPPAGKQLVKVVGKSWDDNNHLYWYHLEFEYKDAWYRLYTTDGRIDVANVEAIPDQPARGDALDTQYSRYDCDIYYGPGENYAKVRNVTMLKDKRCDVYVIEDGWASTASSNSFFVGRG